MRYNDSPLQNGYTPAKLLMGRGMNSIGYLDNSPVNVKKFCAYEADYGGKQAHKFNQ